MPDRSLESIAEKIKALDIWRLVRSHNWVVKPRGTAFPYFLAFLGDKREQVSYHLMLIEGWKTFLDFICMLRDNDYGFSSSLDDVSHYEVLYLEVPPYYVFLRHDPGYVPRFLNEKEKDLLARMLWETYGVMMRIESDNSLPLKFASDHAMFARVEGPDGVWSDVSMPIPPAQPHVERVTVPKAILNAVKDMPFEQDLKVAVDYRVDLTKATKEPRPRNPYLLKMVNAATGELLYQMNYISSPEDGLRGIWESLPHLLLAGLEHIGKVPGEVVTPSGRVFRLVRSLCNEIPFKLTRDANVEMWK